MLFLLRTVHLTASGDGLAQPNFQLAHTRSGNSLVTLSQKRRFPGGSRGGTEKPGST